MLRKALFGVLFPLAGLTATAGLAAPVEVALSFTVTDELSTDFDVFANAMIAGENHQLHVAQCEKVRLDDIGDRSIVVPVLCDGARLSFSLTDAGVSILQDGVFLSEISLDPGPYLVNGLPMLVE